MATIKTGVELPPPAPDPGNYSQWAQAAEGAKWNPKMANTTLATSINSSGQQVTSVPDATTPDASQSSFDNIPVNQLINPQQAPSAWNTPNPAADLYVGSTDQVKMGHNQIIGAIADKLGVKQKKGESTETLEEAVTKEVMKQHSVKVKADADSNPSVGGGPGFLGQLEGALTGESAGGAEPTPKAKPKKVDATNNGGNPGILGRIEGMLDPMGGAGTAPDNPSPKGMSNLNGIPSKTDPNVTAITKAMHLNVAPGQDPWEAIANKIGVNTSTSGNPQTVKVAQAEAGMRQWLNTPQKISALQSQLEAAGYFTNIQQPGQSEAYTPGNMDIATQQAIGSLLSDTAKANNIVNGKIGSGGSAVTWQDMLNQQTQQVTDAGGLQEVLKKTAVTRIPQATQSQMQNPALTAFEARLGRAPTAAELASLTSDYDAQQQSKYAGLTPGTTVFNDDNGIPSVPGVATPEQAASQFASANNPSEAFGHSMLNAASMMANIIGAGGPNTSNIAGTTNPTDATPPL